MSVLSSTQSGTNNWHIGEIWHIGQTDYEIISWFERKGERYYIGMVKHRNPAGGYFEFYHILYKYKGEWKRYD